MAAGAPGLLVAVLIWITVRDPRGNIALRQALQPDPNRLSLKSGLAALSGKSAYWHIIAAGTLVQFVAYGFGSFYGSFFVRVHGMGYAELGWKLGLMVGITGGFASWIGGLASNRLLKRSMAAPLNVNGLLLAFSVGPAIYGLYTPSENFALVMFAAPVFAASYYFGSTFAAIQTLARDETRAFAVALYSLIASLIGLGLGPVIVGIVSDLFASYATNSMSDAQSAEHTIGLRGDAWRAMLRALSKVTKLVLELLMFRHTSSAKISQEECTKVQTNSPNTTTKRYKFRTGTLSIGHLFGPVSIPGLSSHP